MSPERAHASAQRRRRVEELPVPSVVWRLWQVREGGSDADSSLVWIAEMSAELDHFKGVLQNPNPPSFVSPARDSAEPQVARTSSRYFVDKNARIISVDVGQPIAHKSLRMRFREDLTRECFFEDAMQRVWHVEGWSVLSPGRWIEVRVVAFEHAPLSDLAAFTVPTGWTLAQDGRPIQVLTVGAVARTTDAYRDRIGIRFAHDQDWTATNFVADDLGFGVELPGGKGAVLFFTDDADFSEGLGAGEFWPGVGAAIVDSKTATRKVLIGSTIRIDSS